MLIPDRARAMRAAAFVAALSSAFAPHGAGFVRADGEPPAAEKARIPDVVYVPTPMSVVERMIEVAEIKADDVVYDLGCGDGRIVIAAAERHGVKAVGVDIDPRRVAESRENVRKSGVGDLVTIREQDFFATDLSGATVVMLYLPPNLNARLKPKLARLKRGSRVVSHSFVMKGAKPSRVEKVRMPDGGWRTVYLWVVPWEEDAEGSSAATSPRRRP